MGQAVRRAVGRVTRCTGDEMARGSQKGSAVGWGEGKGGRDTEWQRCCTCCVYALAAAANAAASHSYGRSLDPMGRRGRRDDGRARRSEEPKRIGLFSFL